MFADEDDFFDVQQAVFKLSSHYYNIGLYLGLSAESLKRIQEESIHNSDLALEKVLNDWLGRKYDVEMHGCPTWRRLVEAVNSPDGGNHPALAKEIASCHQVSCKII